MSKKIPFFSLVVLIIAAIDSIRNLPSSALFGSALIFFFIFAAIVFLIPTSLVAAELSAIFPEKGGVYHWVHAAFGEKWAMAAIWLQWINTMVWYPTILSFIAGTAAYLINPALAENKTYLVGCILVVFWVLTVINLRGLHMTTWINNICALIGTVLPLLFLIALGIVWITGDHPLQITISNETVFPHFGNSTSWISLIAIMASYLGIELASVHVGDIRNPQRNFPRAVLLASGFILVTMLFGSLTIAFVLPAEKINLVAGVVQVFDNFFRVFDMPWLTPVMIVLIVVGTVGSIINWLISPAKGLLHAAEFGFLPKAFSRKNDFGVASNILLVQALVVSFICLAFLLVPSVNGFYWFLTALSTELYMIMYILMFLAALRLHFRYVDRPKSFKIPGGNYGMWTTVIFGLFGCGATIAVSFFPPENIQIGSAWHYFLMICIGNVLTLAPLGLFFWYKARKATA